MATYSKDPEHNVVQLERWKRMVLALPTIRSKGSVPWGYAETSPGFIEPIDSELEWLAEGLVHLKKYSLKSIADWLYAKTGRRITYQGLLDIKRMRPLDQRVTRLIDGHYRLIPILERLRLYRESNLSEAETQAIHRREESKKASKEQQKEIS